MIENIVWIESPLEGQQGRILRSVDVGQGVVARFGDGDICAGEHVVAAAAAAVQELLAKRGRPGLGRVDVDRVRGGGDHLENEVRGSGFEHGRGRMGRGFGGGTAAFLDGESGRVVQGHFGNVSTDGLDDLVGQLADADCPLSSVGMLRDERA